MAEHGEEQPVAAGPGRAEIQHRVRGRARDQRTRIVVGEMRGQRGRGSNRAEPEPRRRDRRPRNGERRHHRVDEREPVVDERRQQ